MIWNTCKDLNVLMVMISFPWIYTNLDCVLLPVCILVRMAGPLSTRRIWTLESDRNEFKSWSEWINDEANRLMPKPNLSPYKFPFLYLSTSCPSSEGGTMAIMPGAREINCGLDNSQMPFVPLCQCEPPCISCPAQAWTCLVLTALLGLPPFYETDAKTH